MAINSAIVRELVAAGVTGDALVTALERIEAASIPVRSKGAERTARWRERKAERHGDVTNVTCDDKERVSHTLPKETTTPSLPTSAREPSVSRGTRLPGDFEPLPSIIELGKLRGLTDFEITDQLERFRDWANAATGQVGTKRDWQGTFRNWIKRAADDKRKSQSRYGSKPTPGQAITDAFDDLDRHIAGRRAEAGHG